MNKQIECGVFAANMLLEIERGDWYDYKTVNYLAAKDLGSSSKQFAAERFFR